MPDTILKVQLTEPERVRKHNARVPADLEAIIVKCLEKDRARRYATAADLAADLGRWQRGEPVLAQPPSLSYLLRKQAWRYRVPLAAAALVLLVAVIGVVAAFLQINDALGRERQAKGKAETKEREAQDSLAKEQKALADLKTQLSVLARSYCDRSDSEFRKGNVADSLNWILRAYEVAPTDDPLRPSYGDILAAQARALGRPLLHEGTVNAVAFSPDGRAVLTGSNDGTARLWDAATGKPLGEPLPQQGIVNAVAFSPDGRAVLTGGWDHTARLWAAATGKPLGEPLRHEDIVNAVAFSPDGRTVLTGSIDGTARLWDAATGKPLGEPLRHEGNVDAVAFSPDGRAVLTGSTDKTARLWDTVAPAPDEPARLRAWVAVRTGKAFDDRGILRQLTQAEWLQHWQELDANGGDWAPPPDARRWHRIQAAEAEVAGQWFGAVFHLKWLLKEDPGNEDLRRRLEAARAHLKPAQPRPAFIPRSDGKSAVQPGAFRGLPQRV